MSISIFKKLRIKLLELIASPTHVLVTDAEGNVGKAVYSSGSSQTLQEVTDLGNTTTKPIISTDKMQGTKFDVVVASNINDNLEYGSEALENATASANRNTAIGTKALNSITGSDDNTALGYFSLYAMTIGARNTAMGVFSMSIGSGNNRNTAFGYRSTQAISNSNDNVGIGDFSLGGLYRGNENTAVGQSAGLTGGAIVYATVLVAGVQYQIQTIGTTDFTLIGATSNTVGTIFTATGAGTGTGQASAIVNGNTCIGFYTGTANQSGSNSTFLGRYAGVYVVGGTQIRHIENGVFIGANNRPLNLVSYNEIVIGANMIGAGNNTATYGDGNITKHIFSGGVLIAPLATNALITSLGNKALITKEYAAANYLKPDLSSLGAYANDAAAAAAGVAIGFAYINSSTGALHRRLT